MGGQHNGGISSKGNQTFDSSGPDIRVRGNAHQVLEKYLQMARDAGVIGDRVAAENYLQHAEHYYRMIAAQTEGQRLRVGGRELSVAEVNVQNVSQGLSAALYATPVDGLPAEDQASGQPAPNGNFADDEDDQENFNSYQGRGNRDGGNRNGNQRDHGGGENRQYEGRNNDQRGGDGRSGPRRHQRGPNRHEGPRHDGQRQDGQRQDGQRVDSPRPDNAHSDGQRQDSQRQDSHRQDDPRQDGLRQDNQRPDAERQDNVTAEAVRPVPAPVDVRVAPIVQDRRPEREPAEQPDYPSELLPQPIVSQPAMIPPEVQPSLALAPAEGAPADTEAAPARRPRGRPRGTAAPRRPRAAANANSDTDVPASTPEAGD
jgi:hypothetical protein